MLHIYPMCGIFYLSSTGTRDCQSNVSSEWHQDGISLMDVYGKFGFSEYGQHIVVSKSILFHAKCNIRRVRQKSNILTLTLYIM